MPTPYHCYTILHRWANVLQGDVHDIGKNIVGVVLGCNNFKVHMHAQGRSTGSLYDACNMPV